MKCLVCQDSNLLMTERQGVEIDYCPQCRGVWLDRGELDKLIERSTTGIGAMPVAQPNYPPNGYPRKNEHHSSHHAVMGRNSTAKSLGLAKFLIDRTKHVFNNTAGLISARGTCCGSLCAFHTTD